MKMETKKLLYRVFSALFLPLLFCAAAWSGILDTVDGALSDWLYQRPDLTIRDAEVTVIGITDKDLGKKDALWPWSGARSDIAQAVRILNADPDHRPAVIGIDVLFAGASENPEDDENLAAAIAEGGNVVLASAGTIEKRLIIEEDGSFYMNPRMVTQYVSPYPMFAEAAAGVGHVNALADDDHIIRRALPYLDTPSGEHIKLFSRILYERYCAYWGITPNPEPPTQDGMFYIPFADKPKGYSSGISFLDFLEGTWDPAEFEGKVVLIGPYALGMTDDYFTAVSRNEKMYGIEIQANLIDAYRRGFFPQNANQTTQLLLLFAACAFVQAFLYDRRIRTAVPVWLALSLGWIGLCLLFYRRGIRLHALWTPLFVSILFFLSVAGNYIRAQRERRRVTETFGRYVDPAIMKELLSKGGEALELGGVMREIAVLFVDIRGFTTMSESLDPPTVVEIINQYLTLTTECIMRRRGTLDKFVGDCTMAFWNAPLDQEDPAYLACQAAMDMVEGSKELGEQLQARFGRTVSFGVGVNLGPAVVGNIGAPRRMDYTAIGDTVNTAARLEANAPGGKILISRAVADALGSRAKTTSLGSSIRLKGKAEGFEILTLDALE